MNGATLLLAGIIFFSLSYLCYGRYLRRLFGIDPGRPTPAHTQHDGVDYVPARLPVLFGHHFASIAGAGPIVGPVLAMYLGWGPIAIWVLLGAVFIGAMHDFAALFLSVRNGGRSIGHVIERLLGYAGRQVFILFSLAALILVVAMFVLLVARTFTEQPAVATASLIFIAMAPVFGYLVQRRGVSVLLASSIFVPLVFLSVWIGIALPCDLTQLLGWSPEKVRTAWLGVLLAYAFVASTLPVWLLLQPRDYLNSFLLYSMVLLGAVGIFAAAPRFEMPAFTGWSVLKPDQTIMPLFPILYVTVACGACSGFHALVSSGTSAKQISSERHILPIGYGAMLVEGLVALMALTSVAVLSTGAYASKVANPVEAFASGLAGFAARIGIPEHMGATFIALTVSAFLLTTLDTATRLARFAFQELFLPRAGGADAARRSVRALVSNRFFATSVAVAAAGTLALTGRTGQIWPVFGAANQLLAALTLLVVTLYLVRRRANFWVALIPMVFMVTITAWALVLLFGQQWNAPDGQRNYALLAAVTFLLATATALAVKAVASLRTLRDGSKDSAA